MNAQNYLAEKAKAMGVLFLPFILFSFISVKEIPPSKIIKEGERPELDCNRYDGDSRTKFGYALHKGNIILQFEIIENAGQFQYSHGGTKVYFDENGKKGKSCYILLPKGGIPEQKLPFDSEIEQQNGEMDRQFPTMLKEENQRENKEKMGDGQHRKNPFTMANELAAVVIDGKQGCLKNRIASKGISSELWEKDGRLIHTIIIPLKLFKGEFISIGLEGGKTEQMPGRMGSGRPDGNMQGRPGGMGGGPGGMGTPPNGNQGGMGGRPHGSGNGPKGSPGVNPQFTPANFWFKIKNVNN